MSTVAASTATHFTIGAVKYPRNFIVEPYGTGAGLRAVDGGRFIEVPLGSTVAGSVPADQNALIDALAAIVTPASTGGGGGATASEIGTAVNTLPALTNRSGTVTTGGTAQQIMASNSSRKVGYVTNLNTASAWISEVGTAAADTAGSVELPQGATYVVEGQGAVSYLHATTGAKFTATEG